MEENQNKKNCILRTGFGLTEEIDFKSWAEEVIQDWDTAFNIAAKMLDTHPMEYAWNEEQHPQYYEEFYIKNKEEFIRQRDSYI